MVIFLSFSDEGTHVTVCFFGFFKNKFIYFWLHRVFIAVCGPFSSCGSRGYSSLRCAGFSLWWLLLLWSTGCRRASFSTCGTRASVVVARGL